MSPVAADYDLISNTYVSKKQEPQVEVGDIKQADFQPQLKLKRWENEANISLRLIDLSPDAPAVSLDGDVIKWTKPNLEARFYSQGWGVDKGAFEFEVVLLSKPVSNMLTFSLQSKELEFFHQPPLTPTQIADGANRPDSVVGSYAVYHATKSNIHVGQGDAVKYKAGKAFHIYRPRVTDALGKSVWGELNIDAAAGTLTIIIDQTWLDNAIYPVVVDPTFGYDTIGGTTSGFNKDRLDGNLHAAPADVATADSITIYSKAVAAAITVNFKGVLVEHAGLTIIANGVGDPFEATTTPAWRTSTFSISPSLTPLTDYVLMMIHDDGDFSSFATYYYDAGDVNQEHNDATNNYAVPQDPIGAGHQNDRFSIYATYTAAPSGEDVVGVVGAFGPDVQRRPGRVAGY